MGKKMKKKAPNPRKAQNRISSGSPKSVIEVFGGDVNRDKNACNHYTKSTSELNQILLKIRSSSMHSVSCEHCREEPVNRRGGKGKQAKKKGAAGARSAEAKSEHSFMWVCLDCGLYFCGGEVSILEPYGHARRHAKQEHHNWTVRADDPLISWCYSCSLSVPIEMPDDLIKEGTEESLNDRSGSSKGIAFEPLNLEKLKGHKIRGLSNLGNTCFFNSVMQNLLAMDILREKLLSLDRPVGPLFGALRTLFGETSRGADSKGVINPKALFGCICAKAPQFRGYQQQDSHELLRYLLDGLHMEETNARKKSEFADDEEKSNVKTKATLVDDVFCGRLSSTVSCLECRHTSVVNEPFLDLSLPVPSKKHAFKKVPPLPSKRANQRDKNKSRQARERGVTQVSVNHNIESNEQPSECSESEIAVSLPTHDAPETHDSAWMDYLGGESPNCNDSCAQQLEGSIVHSSDCKQENEVRSNEQSVSEFHNDSESNAQSVSDLHTASCSNDLTVSSETCVERSYKDEVPHSCAPVTGIILLPCKEQDQDLADLDINDRTSFCQDPENVNPIDVFVSESCSASSICKQAEEDFDGFGDLFNEPEASSHLNSETNVGEDMDITLLNGTFNESNLEEVDDSDIPVSVNSCLALFTKSELLSDEQAWYCERCSGMLQENREFGTSKLQAAEVSDLSVTLKSMGDEDECLSKNVAFTSHSYSANVKVLDNGKLVYSPKNVTIPMEERLDQCEEMNSSQKQSSQEGTQSSGEISCNETLHLTPSLDKDMSESETSQYLSTPSICVNYHAQDGSNNQESYFHCINDRSNVENDGKKPKVASHSSQSHTNILSHNSSVDRSQEVNRVRKKGLKSGKVHPAKEKGEGIKMVKRDATKRILIDIVPLILTIHLKRFSQDARGRSTKLSGHVNFQETLDLRPYMDPRCIKDRTSYRLIGVVEHSGSMSGGHYVAYVRGEGRGSKTSTGSSSTGHAWFYASDAYVREVTLAEVLQSEAYILFYEKI